MEGNAEAPQQHLKGFVAQESKRSTVVVLTSRADCADWRLRRSFVKARYGNTDIDDDFPLSTPQNCPPESFFKCYLVIFHVVFAGVDFIKCSLVHRGAFSATIAYAAPTPNHL